MIGPSQSYALTKPEFLEEGKTGVYLQRDTQIPIGKIDGSVESIVLPKGTTETEIAREISVKREALGFPRNIPLSQKDEFIQVLPWKIAKAEDLKTPVPGRITKIFVKKGQEIQTGTPLYEIECMKMYITITSEIDGVVDGIHAASKESMDCDSVVVSLIPRAYAWQIIDQNDIVQNKATLLSFFPWGTLSSSEGSSEPFADPIAQENVPELIIAQGDINGASSSFGNDLEREEVDENYGSHLKIPVAVGFDEGSLQEVRNLSVFPLPLRVAFSSDTPHDFKPPAYTEGFWNIIVGEARQKHENEKSLISEEKGGIKTFIIHAQKKIKALTSAEEGSEPFEISLLTVLKGLFFLSLLFVSAKIGELIFSYSVMRRKPAKTSREPHALANVRYMKAIDLNQFGEVSKPHNDNWECRVLPTRARGSS